MTVIAHNSRLRAVWDVFAVALAMVSIMVITYQIAFVRVPSVGGSLLVYAIDLFFLFDIWLNFRTSFRRGGEDVLDRGEISQRYLHGRFVLDLLATVPFDALLLLLANFSWRGISAVLIVRALRGLRVLRLLAVFDRWSQLSWVNTGSLRIAKLVLLIGLALHIVSCGWFLVPFVEGFPGDSWVVLQGLEAASPLAQYVRSVYWAVVTTTTVGYGDITPHRTVEYVFSTVTILLGASIYAFFIGNIASLVSNLDSTKASFWNRVETVNQYLRTRGVSTKLNQQVRDYYEYIWARFRGMNERSLLIDLPPPIRLEILLQLTRELMENVPLFRYCSPALRNVLLLALKPQISLPGSLIVREGELGEGIFFISGGEAEIFSAHGRNFHGTLSAGDHFGDLSLMLGEKRTAEVRASTYCDIFVLEKEDFERIKSEYSELREVLRRVSADQSDRMSALVLDGIVL